MMDYEIKAVITKGIHEVLSGIGSPISDYVTAESKGYMAIYHASKKLRDIVENEVKLKIEKIYKAL